MNVLQNLIGLYVKLPMDSTYRNVIRSLLEQLPHMKDITVYEMADRTNASRTTLSRMVQKLGYKSVSDFQYALNSALDQYQFYNRLLPQPSAGGESQLLEDAIRGHQHAAELLRSNLTPERLYDLTMQLGHAGQVHFFLPFFMSSALSFMQNLSMAEKKTSYQHLIPDMQQAAEEFDENSILIIGTIEYAEALSMKSIFHTAREKGATIWLAAEATSRYRKYADDLLLPGTKDGYTYLQALDSMLLVLSENFRDHFLDQEQIPEW